MQVPGAIFLDEIRRRYPLPIQNQAAAGQPGPHVRPRRHSHETLRFRGRVIAANEKFP